MTPPELAAWMAGRDDAAREVRAIAARMRRRVAAVDAASRPSTLIVLSHAAVLEGAADALAEMEPRE
jgi:broad specificity phosphatase PhoE